MVTPLSYEGLVDITLGIDHGRIRVESALLGSDESNDLGGGKAPPTNSNNNAGK